MLLLVFCCLCNLQLYAQNFPEFVFTKSSINNNLPSGALSYVFKDSKGFVWISTAKGLCRYDGTVVKVFTHDDKINSLANNNTGFVVEDNESNIWVSHLKGVSRYNRNKNDFTNFSYSINSKKDTVALVFGSLSFSNNNEIVLGDMNGYKNSYYDKKANCFKNIIVDTIKTDNQNQQSKPIEGLLRTANNSNDLYLVGLNGLFSYDLKTAKRNRLADYKLRSSFDLYKDTSGHIWLSDLDGGLRVIDPNTKKQQSIITNKTISYITDYKDVNGKLWIIASELKSSSIVIIDPITKKYTFQIVKTENGITPNISVGKIVTVSQGNMYFSTLKGLYKMEENRKSISNVFTYKIGSPVDIYNDNLIRSGVQLSNTDFLFSKLGTNGLLIYDSNLVLKKTINNYRYNNKKYDLDVRCFYKIEDNKYFLTGTTGIALYENGKIIPLIYSPSKKSGDISSLCREMMPIDKNNYWVRLLSDNLVKYNVTTNTLSEPITTASGNVPLTNLLFILNDNQGNLWAISNENVFKHNNNEKQFETLTINNDRKKEFKMRTACFDTDQNLWITGLGGLLKYDTKTKKENYYEAKDGLKEEEVYRALPFDNNSIIITHKTGISHFNYFTQKFTNINNNDDFPYSTNEYDAALILDKNKNVLIGNSGVITKINISNYLSTPLENIKINITQVEGSNTDEEIKLDGNLKKVDLHFENFPVNILFSVINYSATDERLYYYRYKGKDTSWIKCKNGVVPINTITPGNYTIEVTGSINGIFANKTDSIVFTIVPRWFETILFKILASLVSLIVLLALYKWRINTAKKSALQLAEIQRLAAQEYKTQLELSQVSNYFSTSLSKINNIEEALWDVSKNLIGQLSFEDCVIYVWNNTKTKLIQKAGYGVNRTVEEIKNQPFDTVLGQGIVGFVAENKEGIIVPDTRKDKRYRPDVEERLSEICVPIMYQDELLGIIDSEHSQLNFYTKTHLQLLNTIAGYIGAKIVDIKNNEALTRASNQLNEVQLDALRSQMNPHFIFNCLNSIKLYTAQNQNQAAAEYLTKFSKLMRKSLENSRSHQISLADELETLELYIQLEGMRFKEKLKYSITVSPEIDSTFIEIPPMLLQPHVENAIWHGLMHKDLGGQISIDVKKQPNENILIITIEDDGIGREKAAKLKSKTSIEHKSFGTKLIDERLLLINKIYNINAAILITDKVLNKEAAGTIITLKIPFE